MNIFARCGIRPQATCVIIGIGFLGALLTSLASRVGASVIAISRRPFALELARRYGARDTFLMTGHDKILRRVLSLTQGRGADVVVECVGEQGPLDLASALTRDRGRLVIAGYHQAMRRVDMQLWNWRGLDVINAHERDPLAYVQGMHLAIEAVVRGDLDPASLFTHELPLDEIDCAFRLVRERPDGFVKALIHF